MTIGKELLEKIVDGNILRIANNTTVKGRLYYRVRDSTKLFGEAQEYIYTSKLLHDLRHWVHQNGFYVNIRITVDRDMNTYYEASANRMNASFSVMKTDVNEAQAIINMAKSVMKHLEENK